VSRIPFVLFTGVLLIAALALARPPDDIPIDPALHDWYESLKEPGTTYPCCSIADCRPIDYRMGGEGYEARIDEEWVTVPDDRVLKNQPNPIGRAVLCRSPVNGSILCFVPASQT
jgi:hypothetical protein